jgi:predicted RNA binding protein YcfA (HicA-like mRNA interferase family)
VNPPLPVLSGERMITILARTGFDRVSQRGSHVKLRRADRVVIVPLHHELAPGTLRSILRQAGLSSDDLLKLL